MEVPLIIIVPRPADNRPPPKFSDRDILQEISWIKILPAADVIPVDDAAGVVACDLALATAAWRAGPR